MHTNYRAFMMAVDRVEQRLRKVTAALDQAGVPYAVGGGNAVAAWVSRVDPSATRTTKDVDLLVRRLDDARITAVMQKLGYVRDGAQPLVLFIDPDEPSKRSSIHLIWADTLIRPSYSYLSPAVTEAVRDPQGFAVVDLPALIRMKLTSFRDIDRVHIADLLEVGLIDDKIRASLPNPLLTRLDEIQSQNDPD